MERLERMEANPTSSTTTTKIPPGLTALVRHTYRSLTDLQWQFQPENKFRSNQNEKVTQAVIGAIKDAEPHWGISQVRRACNRVFESYKASNKQDLKGTKEDIKRRKTLTSRRDRLFKKRVKVGQRILSPEDWVYLCGADANFISDEDSDEDKTSYKFASPKWRAARLSGIMKTCQKALDSNRKKAIEPRSNRTHLERNVT
ncbi:uncharacterized protein LOC114458578 [Gouania willdenowi]|uniref:uncharacterized protein LOC114458578 n=1 Tax=Gouania willdenowi TaxID=441366 RepID=UPI0010560272|nr:uncharacterized protein LOC114458578 [Gouania willdenowi]